MKKLIITICFAAILGILCGQSKYESSMQKAIELNDQNQVDASVALLERIAQVETANWFPTYHAGRYLVVKSFSISDKDSRINILERAKLLINETHKRSNDNAEVISLEAMMLTSYMAFDPATYGMMFAQEIAGLHSKAYQLDPENPRVLVGKIQYDYGKARFFGEDTSSYCEEMKKIIPKLKAEKQTTAFAPHHGLEEAEGFIQQCK